MFDLGHQLLQGAPLTHRQQHLAAAAQRRVAELDDARLVHRRQEADFDGARHVHVVGEAPRQVEAVHLLRRYPQFAGHDGLAAVVGGLGLRQVAGVAAREGNAVLRHHGQLRGAAVVGKDSLGGHLAVAAQLGEQVDQPGAADAGRRRAADGTVLKGAAAPAQPFDGALVGGHAVAHQSALERRPRGAGGGDHAPLATRHHLGVGAHVHQHHQALLRGQVHRHQVGGGVRPHVTGYQRQAVDARLRMDGKPQRPRRAGQRRGAPFPGPKLIFDP